VGKNEQPAIYKGLPWDELESRLRDVLPKTKTDIENAKAVINLGLPVVKPLLSHLLIWMKDYNWPVAKIIGPFLSASCKLFYVVTMIFGLVGFWMKLSGICKIKLIVSFIESWK